MISCDDCQLLYHFSCVGVDGNIANCNWSCQECLKAKVPAPMMQSTGFVNQMPDFRLPSTIASTGKTQQSCMSVSAQPAKISSQASRLQSATLQSPVVAPLCSQPKFTMPSISEANLSEHAEQKTNRSIVELQMKLLEEEWALERKFLRRKYDIMTSAYIYQPPHIVNASPEKNTSADDTFRPLTHNSSKLQSTQRCSREVFLNDATSLNSSQLAARQAIDKELPVYSGDPDEWPLFIATFENTTRLCGYTPKENIARLQRSLKGRALEAVRSQLLHPTNMNSALSTLKMLFGRPEIIVHSLIQKINMIPAPEAENFNSLVDFALAVRNLVATVQACNIVEHLYNITLLQGLVERLPPMIKLNWAIHRQILQKVTLLEFNNWLYTLAEAVSAVTFPQIQTDDTNPNYTFKTRSTCFLCNEICRTIERCKKFTSFDHNARWAVVRQFKLCRCCLRSHRGLCRLAKVCGKNGCPYKHHTLLHNDTKNNFFSSSCNVNHTSPAFEFNNTINPEHSGDFTCSTHRLENAEKCESVLFQYIPITLHNKGLSIHTYAFIDSGSSVTLLEESLAQRLNLTGEKRPLKLQWTSGTCRHEDSAVRVNLDVSGTSHDSKKYHLSGVYTVKNMKLPSQSLSVSDLRAKYNHLKDVPAESYEAVQPRILIGIDNIRLTHTLDSREGKEHEPIATKTRLGWTIFGECLQKNNIPRQFSINYHYSKGEDLSSIVKNINMMQHKRYPDKVIQREEKYIDGLLFGDDGSEAIKMHDSRCRNSFSLDGQGVDDHIYASISQNTRIAPLKDCTGENLEEAILMSRNSFMSDPSVTGDIRRRRCSNFKATKSWFKGSPISAFESKLLQRLTYSDDNPKRNPRLLRRIACSNDVIRSKDHCNCNSFCRIIALRIRGKSRNLPKRNK